MLSNGVILVSVVTSSATSTFLRTHPGFLLEEADNLLASGTNTNKIVIHNLSNLQQLESTCTWLVA
jgi:hypothetical protein